MRLARFLVVSLFAVGVLSPSCVFAHGGAEEEALAPAESPKLYVPTQIGAEAPAMTPDPTFGLPRNMVFSAVQPVVQHENERANIRYMLLIAAIGLIVAAHLPKYREDSMNTPVASSDDQSRTPAV